MANKKKTYTLYRISFQLKTQKTIIRASLMLDLRNLRIKEY